MKVLLVASWYPSPEYPAHGVFIERAAKLLGNEHQVTVIHPQVIISPDPKIEVDSRMDQGINVIRVKGYLPINPRKAAVYYSYLVFHAWKQLYFKPDVIHAHVTYPAGTAAAILAETIKVPLIVTEHSFPSRLLNSRKLRQLALYTWDRAEVVITVGDKLKKEIITWGCHSPLGTVPNSIDENNFYLRNTRDPVSRNIKEPVNRGRNKLKIISVGLMGPDQQKDFPMLLKALKVAEQKGLPPYEMHIVGDGLGRSFCEKRAEELGIKHKCYFHGILTGEQVGDMMRDADFFVLASKGETFGCVLIEAISCGLPVVSTPVGVAPQIVTAETGILTPVADAEKMANALMCMADKYSSYNKRVLTEAVVEYKPKEVSKRLNRIYKSVVKRFSKETQK